MKKFLATLMMACLLFGTVSAFAQPTPGDDKTATGDKDKKEHKHKKDKDKDKDKKDKDKDDKKGDK